MATKNGIGIIGTGWGTRVQVPAFRAAGLEVVALAGSQAEKTGRIAAELGVPLATGDWRELLRRDEVALVSIVTPPVLHCEMSVAALLAGKHVLCEKPTAMHAAEAQAMLAAAEAHPQQLALVDHELRFLPALQLARRMVAEGAIGAVRHAEVRLVASGRADPTRPWNWWADATQGGGALGAIGSHQVDTLRFLLQDEVIDVQGGFTTFIRERPDGAGGTRPVTADDFACAVLRFGRGTLATLTINLVAPVDELNSTTLHGARASLRFASGKLWHAEPGNEWRDISPPHHVSFPPGISGDFPEATVYLAHALQAALAGDTAALAPAATFSDGLRIQQVLDAVRRADGGSWQPVG